MSREVFNDDCPGCEPAIIDLNTHQRMANDSPTMRAMLAWWRTGTTRDERAAFHRVCCLNSRAPLDLRINESLIARMVGVIKKAERQSHED